ncbi:fibrous sheath-interacting protein 2 [Ranitomeya variabilis]|uniref:fibrous sheath-interacting protein 2 n=1 Tax=Ranitomeya variabilis TaxID=490064 RepID=UPI00405767DC
MASKYPVKSGYKYSFYRTRLGEPLHQPAFEFDLTDPNCYLVRTEYNNLHDPHLKSFFYNKSRYGQLQTRGYITKNNHVKCSLLEFNQYNNYIQHKMIALNRQYLKEQENIRKQIDSITKSNAKLLDRIDKREQYKTQLLKIMEKNWRKNDLRLSQMRKERSQELKPIKEKKKTVSEKFDDSEDESNLHSSIHSSTINHSKKTISESSEIQPTSLTVTSPKDLSLTPDLQLAREKFGDLSDVASPILDTYLSTYVTNEETTSGLHTSKSNTISSTMATSEETMMKSELPVCDLQHFRANYSTMFQNIFEAQSDYLSSVSEDLIEIAFGRLTSAASGHHIGFTPVQTVPKETLHDIRGKSPCRYLISRLEVISAASEIAENALSKWHETAVQTFSFQYDDTFEERSSFKKLYKVFSCVNSQEEMYKATLPVATASILESSEEIAKIVLGHLETFSRSRFKVPFKQNSDSAEVDSLKHTPSRSDDNRLEARLLCDTSTPIEQCQILLKKELENLATSIDNPGHKVYVTIQELIKTVLNLITADIDYDRRQEIRKKVVISDEEKFLLYKYLGKNYTPTKKEPLRSYSRTLLLATSQESHVSRKYLISPESEHQAFRHVIEEVNVPGMASCLEEDKHDSRKLGWRKVDPDRQCRGYLKNVYIVAQPLDNQNKLENNCFLLNMFSFDHLIHSQNEFNRPLKVIDVLVSETLIKILKDLKYPIPEYLYGFPEFPNTDDTDITIKYQKARNTLLLPSDIRSFSHHLVEYILKIMYATSSYENWKESFQSIFSPVKDVRETYTLTDCPQVASASDLFLSEKNRICEEIVQTVSAKFESFLLLKFKKYLTAGHIVDTDLMLLIPEMFTKLEICTKGIISRILGVIAKSISQKQTQDQLSKDDTIITHVLISTLLDHIRNEQFGVNSEEWWSALSALHECLDGGCVLHNVYDRTIPTYSQKSQLLDITSSTLGVAFRQIMETIKEESMKYASDQSTLLEFETDLSKCCKTSVRFLQMEIDVLSESIVEDLINILCSAKQKIKEDTSLLKYEGSDVPAICDIFSETVSNLVLRGVFGKFRRFISLAVKVINPYSKNVSKEIYFPEMFPQQDVHYGPAEHPNRKIKSTMPKSNLYSHSKHLSHEIMCVIWTQLDKISNNIRQSVLGDEAVRSESISLLDPEVEKISLHSSFSEDESIRFHQDKTMLQNIETYIRKNIVQKLSMHLKRKESVTPEIESEVKKVMLMLFKQLLIDLSVPLKLTHSSQMSKFHQQLLSETLQHADSSPFNDYEVHNLSWDILKILSDIMHVCKLHDQTDSSARDIMDLIYGVKPIKPILKKIKNIVISKIFTLFRQLIQSETKKDILSDTRLESYARELADNIVYQAEEHLHEQFKDNFPYENFLPLSNIDIANHIFDVLLQSLKYTYQPKGASDKLKSCDKVDTEEKAIKSKAIEIVERVEIIIKNTIDHLTTIVLSNLTLDICARNLASSVTELIQRESEQERRFMYGGMKYIIDKNTLATEVVNIILQKFYAMGVSHDTSLTHELHNIDSIDTYRSKYERSLMSHSSSTSEPELLAMIQQVECVLHKVQTEIALQLNWNQSNESSSNYLCESSLGISRSDIEFVAKDIIEIIIAKLSKYIQDVQSYANLSYEAQSSMSLEPEETPCFSEERRSIFHFIHTQSDDTNSTDEFDAEESLLSHHLLAAVNDKTTAFADTIAFKCKPHLPVHEKNENIGTFLARVNNNSSSSLELYSQDIVVKVLENITPRITSKLLHVHDIPQHEGTVVTHLIDNLLHKLSFKYYNYSNVSEKVSSYNVCTESDTKTEEAMDHLKAFTPKLLSPSSVSEQRRFTVIGVVLSTSSSMESDSETREAVDHIRASTPKPPTLLSSSVNEERRFSVPVMVPPTSSNADSSSPIVSEQRRYNIRLHFL